MQHPSALNFCECPNQQRNHGSGPRGTKARALHNSCFSSTANVQNGAPIHFIGIKYASMRPNALSGRGVYNTDSQQALSTPRVLTSPFQHAAIKHNFLVLRSSSEGLQCSLKAPSHHLTVFSRQLRNIDDCKSSPLPPHKYQTSVQCL